MNRMNKRRGRTFLEPLQNIFWMYFFFSGGGKGSLLIMVFSDV